MRIVLDSNILLVIIGKKSRLKPIWNNFIDGRYSLIVSEDILYEYEEILQRQSAPGIAEIVIEIFNESPYVDYQKVYYSWNMITQDPDDNKFFDVAVAGGADYLVTDDVHFDFLKHIQFPKVKIITAHEYLELIISG